MIVLKESQTLQFLLFSLNNLVDVGKSFVHQFIIPRLYMALEVKKGLPFPFLRVKTD
jgi:hypothetical protein